MLPVDNFEITDMYLNNVANLKPYGYTLPTLYILYSRMIVQSALGKKILILTRTYFYGKINKLTFLIMARSKNGKIVKRIY